MIVALVALDNERLLMHRVRGSGVYASSLSEALKKNYPNDSFITCSPKKISDDVDIVHFLYFEPFFKTLPLFKKRKTVVTVHDLIPFVFPKSFPSGVRGNINWNIQKIALKNSDAIITDSKSSKNDIEKYAGVDKNKINVVYLAANEKFREINKEKAKQKVKKKFNLPDKFVLYVGDVTWNKNLPRLIEAVIKKDLTLVLVGKALISKDFDKTNPWNQDLLKIQDLSKKDKKIIRLGFVSDNDLVALYNAATVFTMPSIYEGFGLPVLEAMSCGCPVVTTREGSIPEIAEEAAFYVDPNDIMNVAGGIEKVFNDDSLRIELSKKGLERAKNFSWEKTAAKTYNVYEKLL